MAGGPPARVPGCRPAALASQCAHLLGLPPAAPPPQNAPSSSADPDSAPPSTTKDVAAAAAAAPRARPPRGSAHRPLSLSLAVEALAKGSPRQADGVAQYLATSVGRLSMGGGGGKGPTMRASHPPPSAAQRASRSSFLKRPPTNEPFW